MLGVHELALKACNGGGRGAKRCALIRAEGNLNLGFADDGRETLRHDKASPVAPASLG